VGLQFLQPRWLYLAVGAVLLVRFAGRLPRLKTGQRRRAVAPFLAAAVVIAAGALTNSELLILLLPGAVTAVLGGVFLYSLFRPPSMVETFARMSMPDLSGEDVRYCRNVTRVWAGFFLLNGLIVFLLSGGVRAGLSPGGLAPRLLWTLYAGGISYVLVGLLFAGEYLYRKWKFRRYGPRWPEPLLRRWMPPRGNVTPSFIPLHQLLVQGRAAEAPVASSPAGTHTWADFSRDVLALAAVLREENRERWLLSARDGYAFAVGLMATRQADARAVLPPNRQPDTLAALLEGDVGTLAEKPLPGSPAGPHHHPLEGAAEPATPRLIDRSAPAVELFTSGSTGRRRRVVKTLAQLQDEVRMQEERWRERLEGSTVLSTVSHQHIYGLLFKILWPLAAGRAFDPRSGMYPGEILKTVAERSQPVSLITSPTHLGKLVQLDDVSAHAGRVRVVFSSGGPLPEEVARAANERLGHHPVEILGSTETGGVAWRTQNPHRGGRWHPFEGVRVRAGEDGLLEVRSPLVESPGSTWYGMGDRIALHDDGTFELRGRADREVNLAGKRIALPELENVLTAHAFVEESAVCLHEPPGEPTREVLGAVVVLTREGTNWLEDHDRNALARRLRKHLSASFDPVALPRFWAFPDRMPRDEQGKITVPRLRRLLGRRPVRD